MSEIAAASWRSDTGLSVELERALARLDRRLLSAVDRTEDRLGLRFGQDGFRGLYCSRADAASLLAPNGAGETDPAWTAETDGEERLVDWACVEPVSSRLHWLREAYALSDFDVDAIVVALAPEIDTRYARVYGFIQDDVTRRRPCVDLILEVLSSDSSSRLRERGRFAPSAPLLRQSVFRVDAEEPRLGLETALELDPQIVDLLLEQERLDGRLERCCQFVAGDIPLDELHLDGSQRDRVDRLLARFRERDGSLLLELRGPTGMGRRTLGAAIANAVRQPLLSIDLARMRASASSDRAFEELVGVALREAWFQGAIPLLEHVDDLLATFSPVQLRSLRTAVLRHRGSMILSTTQPWRAEAPPGLVSLELDQHGFASRRSIWDRALRDRGLSISPGDLETLASTFVLTPTQINNVAAQARILVPLPAADAPSDGMPVAEASYAILLSLARAQSGHELEQFAQRFSPRRGWSDIVLPQDSHTQLREMTAWVGSRHRVLGEWGFGRKLGRGRGVTALFTGPSGTGKTLAAEIVAGALDVDLFRIDLAGVISKYIGETEKNLDRIFRAAECANGVLFFDEADALFGKRSEVRDSHDRYANVEISYLLQKMEDYEGIAVLATNLRGNLDDAFVRRLAFSVHFPFPNWESRLRIWRGIWPDEVPRRDDIDLRGLAKAFPLSGGNIRNVALAAAYSAADRDGSVNTDDLVGAVRREFQKMGKPLELESILESLTAVSSNGTRSLGSGPLEIDALTIQT